MRYLSRKNIESLGLSMKRVIELVEEMFVEKGHGRVEMPPKPGLHPLPDAFIHAMPAFIPKFKSAGIKWVSGYPQNLERGLPYIHGLMITNDPATGIPTAVMDATWVTAMRTGAATAVAAKYLARPESSKVGIIACGVQGRSNLEALSCLFKIKHVRAFDTNSAVVKKFAADMAEQLNVEIEICEDLKDAVKDMDMVVTSGPIYKDPKPAIPTGWLKPGAFVSPVDFDSYWQPNVLREANKFVTDDLQQMEYYRSAGYFKHAPKASADLGQIVCGLKPGRENEDEINIALNLGIALEDMAVAPELLRLAEARSVGTLLEL